MTMLAARQIDVSRMLMQALNEDQEGNMLDHRTIFEEDRDFNQGMSLCSTLHIRCHPVVMASLGRQHIV